MKMPNRIRRKSQQAFSLIEVLFGIFLAGMCATILAATMPVANNSRLKANNQNAALSIAQKQVEVLRSIGYPNLTADRLYASGVIDSTTPLATDTYSFTNIDAGVYDSPSLKLPSGQGRLTIEQVGIDLRRVTIQLIWIESGRTKSVRLGTMVANL